MADTPILRVFARNRRIYLVHIAGLFLPGWSPPIHDSFQITPNRELEGWDNDDCAAMIEEGRRQLDRQRADMLDIRSRAQLLLTTGLAVAALFGAQLGALRRMHDRSLNAIWVVGATSLALAILGAAAVLVVRADFNTIDAAVLSNKAPPIPKVLASSYAGMLVVGVKTINTRITLFREAVLWLLTSFSALAVLVVLK